MARPPTRAIRPRDRRPGHRAARCPRGRGDQQQSGHGSGHDAHEGREPLLELRVQDVVLPHPDTDPRQGRDGRGRAAGARRQHHRVPPRRASGLVDGAAQAGVGPGQQPDRGGVDQGEGGRAEEPGDQDDQAGRGHGEPAMPAQHSHGARREDDRDPEEDHPERARVRPDGPGVVDQPLDDPRRPPHALDQQAAAGQDHHRVVRPSRLLHGRSDPAGHGSVGAAAICLQAGTATGVRPRRRR